MEQSGSRAGEGGGRCYRGAAEARECSGVFRMHSADIDRAWRLGRPDLGLNLGLRLGLGLGFRLVLGIGLGVVGPNVCRLGLGFRLGLRSG